MTLLEITAIILGTIETFIVPFLITAVFVVFLWGGVQYVSSAGNETKLEKGKQMLFAGIIGLVAVLSFWGLVRLAMTVAFGSSNPAEFSPSYNNSINAHLPDFDGWMR